MLVAIRNIALMLIGFMVVALVVASPKRVASWRFAQPRMQRRGIRSGFAEAGYRTIGLAFLAMDSWVLAQYLAQVAATYRLRLCADFRPWLALPCLGLFLVVVNLLMGGRHRMLAACRKVVPVGDIVWVRLCVVVAGTMAFLGYMLGLVGPCGG